MKINKIIISSDKTPMYLDFWQHVAITWKKLGFEPILFLISDKETDIYEDEFGLVKELKSVENINTGFQSQIARIYAYKYFDNENALISDIDMFPLQSNYFNKNAEPYDESKIVIYSADAYNTINRYPMCYILGNSEIMKKCLELENKTWGDFVLELKSLNWNWDTDELYISSKINKYEESNPDSVIRLNRGWTTGRANNRIDRVFWRYNLQDLMRGMYIDSHSLRPYQDYQKEIDLMLNNIKI